MMIELNQLGSLISGAECSTNKPGIILLIQISSLGNAHYCSLEVNFVLNEGRQ